MSLTNYDCSTTGLTVSLTPVVKLQNIDGDKHEEKIRTTKLSDWGLYPSVLKWFHDNNWTDMHAWQAEVLNQPGVLDGKNLVFSAPTSAGKTLVGDIIVLRHVFEISKKKVLVILPFVSLVREKMLNLQSMLAGTHIKVGGFMANYHSKGGFDASDIAICTVEKANIYVLKLLEQDKLDEIGMIVVDEINLINDPSRGYKLELLLSKVMTVAKLRQQKIQVIGMSADIPNLKDLANWLDAVYYRSCVRPVPLNEKIVFTKEESEVKTYQRFTKGVGEALVKDVKMKDEPMLHYSIQAISETTIGEKGYPSLLIFYNNKQMLELLAEQIAKSLQKRLEKGVISSTLNQKAIDDLKIALRNCADPPEERLINTVSMGVGYHHADLLIEHKDMIEDAFREGTIRVLVSTSTLSSGVNLPAKRVIVRSPLFGRSMMDIMTYRQMIGRAGRMGFHDEGESILICGSDEAEIGRKLFLSEAPPIKSPLLLLSEHCPVIPVSETVFPENQFLGCIMEAIVTKIATTRQELYLFLDSTFFSAQARNAEKDMLRTQTDAALIFMSKLGLLDASESERDNEVIPDKLKPTSITTGIVFSGMDSNSGIAKTKEIHEKMNKFFVGDDLGLLYFIIQDNSVRFLNVSADKLFDWFMEWTLHSEELAKKKIKQLTQISDPRLSVAQMIGLTAGKLNTARSRGYGGISDTSFKKFYLALALQELINEHPIHEVSSKFNIPKGTLQSLQTNAASFANMASTLCEYSGLSLFKVGYSDLVSRLEYGVSKELVELMHLPSMSPKLARRLFKSGFLQPKMLANLKDDTPLRKAVEAEFKNQKIKVMELRNKETGRQHLLSIKEVVEVVQNEAQQWCEEEVKLLLGLKETDVDPHVKLLPQKDSSVFMSPLKTPTTPQESVACPSTPSTSLKNNHDDLNEEPIPTNLTLSDSRLNDTNTEEPDVSAWIQAPVTPDLSVTVDNRRNFWMSPPKRTNARRKLDIPFEQRLKKVYAVQHKGIIETKHVETVEEVKTLLSLLEFWGIASFLPVSSQNDFFQNGKGSHRHGDEEPIFVNSKSKILEELLICFGDNEVHSVSGTRLMREFGRQLNKKLHGRLKYFTLLVYDVNPVYLVLHKSLGIDRKILFETITWVDIKARRWYKSLEDEEKFPFPNNNLFADIPVLIETICPEYGELTEVKDNNELLVSFTYLLFPLYKSKEWGKNNTDIVNNIETPAALVFADVQSLGLQVDVDKFKELENQVSSVMINLGKTANQLSINSKGIEKPINLDSISSIRDMVYDHLELHKLVPANEVIVAAPNAKSVKKSRLQLFEKYHPLPRVVLDHRIIDHNNSHSILPISQALKESVDDRIYGQVESWTSTGRITMSDPALMMTPKPFSVTVRDTNGKPQVETIKIRSVFVPKHGYVYLSADFSQIELRILAHFSEDEDLLNILNSGGDVFRSLASRVFGRPSNKITNDERQRVKGFCYAIIYGKQSAPEFEEETKTDDDDSDVDEVNEKEKQDFDWFKNTLMSTFPGIEVFRQKVEKDCQELGYVETISGRRRYLPLINHDVGAVSARAKRQALNTMIQGSAADLMKFAMIGLHKEMLDKDMENRARLVHTMHDELIFEVEPLVLREFALLVNQIMSGVGQLPKTALRVELPVNLKTGNNWSNLTEYVLDWSFVPLIL